MRRSVLRVSVSSCLSLQYDVFWSLRCYTANCHSTETALRNDLFSDQGNLFTSALFFQPELTVCMACVFILSATQSAAATVALGLHVTWLVERRRNLNERSPCSMYVIRSSSPVCFVLSAPSFTPFSAMVNASLFLPVIVAHLAASKHPLHFQKPIPIIIIRHATPVARPELGR